MQIETLENGLSMQAEPWEREHIKTLLSRSSSVIAAEREFIIDLLPDQYKQVAPENFGCLTSAPLISDGENLYGFMNYAVCSLLDELTAGNKVFWQQG